jgi:cell division protein FtsI (penicillin-binding protein 3)
MQEPRGNHFFGGPHEPRLDEAAVRRLRNMARIGLVWAVLIVLRLFYLQVIAYGDFKQAAQSQQERVQEIPAMRGMILDRENGTLAKSTALKSVAANPLLVADMAVASEVLSRVLNIDAAELLDRMQKGRAANRGFVWVKRKVSFEESERVKQLKLLGIEFRDETTRTYPKNSILAHVLGGVDHEDRGNGGIEMFLQDELEGIPGSMRMLKDVTKEGYYESVVETKPVPGKNITLTIDERIQFVAEEKLKAAAEGCRCKTGSIVVLNPRNGDILAMASYPPYNPNELPKPGEELSARLNNAIAAPFEPGSVFKVITLAAALETTRLGPESPINCHNGAFSFYGRVIHEAKRGFGVMPMRTVLAKSSNIGALQVGLQVGVNNFHQYITKFGFGKRTGIPLPAESPGQVFEPRKWQATSIGSVAMGHEITTTTLQLAQAIAAVANHGQLVKPRLVLKRERPGGPVEWEPVSKPVQVMRPEKASIMRDMMHDVLLPGGTGYPTATLPGYYVGGKTGSAQIYDHSIKQYTHKYNASFVGIVPLTDPKLVVVVTLNGSAAYGGIVAAPVFHDVAASALRILEVQHDKELTEQVAQGAPTQKPDPAAVADVASAPFAPEPEPAANQPVETAELRLAPQVEGPRTPNLMGKTMRDVITETSALGLTIESQGSGIARTQKPAPGAVLQPGERIMVQFGR